MTDILRVPYSEAINFLDSIISEVQEAQMRRCLAKVEHIRQGTREPGTIGALDEDIALHAHTKLLN